MQDTKLKDNRPNRERRGILHLGELVRGTSGDLGNTKQG